MINLNSESIQSISCFLKLKTIKDNQLTVISTLGALALGLIVFLIHQNLKLKNKIQKLENPIHLQKLNKTFEKLETRCSLLEKMIKTYQDSNKK
ncbi:MAG: hypothetical protein Q8K60_09235 [Parachlamydiaceae bacterium]|nr:hypothetical protein [Parachlamydiaceae bacterium]